jgi:hypothetical protein
MVSVNWMKNELRIGFVDGKPYLTLPCGLDLAISKE